MHVGAGSVWEEVGRGHQRGASEWAPVAGQGSTGARCSAGPCPCCVSCGHMIFWKMWSNKWAAQAATNIESIDLRQEIDERN